MIAIDREGTVAAHGEIGISIPVNISDGKGVDAGSDLLRWFMIWSRLDLLYPLTFEICFRTFIENWDKKLNQ